MKIRINETGELLELNLIHPETNSNFVTDFIGNEGGLITDFVIDRDSGEYSADKETYDWWKKVIDNEQELTDLIHKLSKEHGSPKVQAEIDYVISWVPAVEDLAPTLIKYLKKEFKVEE